MPQFDLDVNPVDRITVDAIGKPGERVFYLQARNADKVYSLLVEKVQLQTLAVGVEQFMGEIGQKYPDLSESSSDFDETLMHIDPPIDPLYRVGEFGLGYDYENDRMVLLAREVVMEGQTPEEVNVIRFWCTRSQVRALCRWAVDLANRGRPICPQCSEPMDPAGHFCPKKNGHKH